MHDLEYQSPPAKFTLDHVPASVTFARLLSLSIGCPKLPRRRQSSGCLKGIVLVTADLNS
jgi:hypothetical protein